MKSKILIVDDEKNIQELLAVNLKAQGFDIISAWDGKEAVEKTMKEKPDLIILDIMMPEMDGWEVCKTVKDQSELNKIKILILTAKGTKKDEMVGKLIFKADEYISKPFDIDELINTVKRLLGADGK
ncbi:MAG: hypothetical protein A3J83_00295 [Elusimicrobia bacterium RIFOXYA2_FULL_40_6]|nr:MAG: hypothetical protein A3J83_00295 [Elusimicrobia bacterium RIFOXYA2_FULL_40_6]